MSATQHEPEDPASLVRDAFATIKKDEVDFDAVTDSLFIAAVQAGSIEMLPSASGALTVKLGGDQSFEIPLPFGTSRFRTVLARVGTICNAASEKNAFVGRALAKLRTAGILKDRCQTESHNQQFAYRRCSVAPVPGSPLYALDALLTLSGPGGAHHDLKVTMKNSPGNSFLRLELVPGKN